MGYGHIVVFDSFASNLDPGDRENTYSDIYAHDHANTYIDSNANANSKTYAVPTL